MKLLIVGDLHLKVSTLERSRDVLGQLQKLASEVNLTVFLGDQYDGKAIIRSEVQNMFFTALQGWPTKCVMLTGNHDYENKTYNTHSLAPIALAFPKTVIVVDKLVQVENLIFLPYMADENFIETLGVVSIQRSSTILFAHQGINGFLYSNGMVELNKLNLEHFKGFKRCFLGHIHRPAEKDNVIYVGTPVTHSFQECDEEKRVMIYDTITDQIQCMSLDIPQHKKACFNIQDETTLESTVKTLKETLKKDKNLWQLVFEVTPELASKVNRKLFKSDNIMSFKKKILQPQVEVVIEESLSPCAMVEKYIDAVTTLQNKSVLKQLNKGILINICGS